MFDRERIRAAVARLKEFCESKSLPISFTPIPAGRVEEVAADTRIPPSYRWFLAEYGSVNVELTAGLVDWDHDNWIPTPLSEEVEGAEEEFVGEHEDVVDTYRAFQWIDGASNFHVLCFNTNVDLGDGEFAVEWVYRDDEFQPKLECQDFHVDFTDFICKRYADFEEDAQRYLASTRWV